MQSSTRPTRGLRRRTAAALLALGLAAGLGACTSPEDGAPEPAGARDVGVQLFQWTWDAIARECTERLGPAGYGWVLTSPPQEHVRGDAWWTAYQPVSYLLESRLGTRAELAAMVETCHEAGVDVVVDAVVNHMTGQDDPGTGWAGSPYSHYDHPGTWSDAAGDFHHCGVPPADDIADYRDAYEVQHCELVNLADLATGRVAVQDRLVAYLQDVLSLGVDGFRIDAAKHMPAEDVAALVERLPEGTRIVSEVIRGGGEPVVPEQYAGSGDVFEFAWGREATGMIRGGSLRLVTELGTGSSYLPSEKAWIFVENHDTERGGSTLGYADGTSYVLANVLMLATGYGRPVVYSGYAFSDRDAGPEQDGDGAVLDAACPDDAGADRAYADGEWVCQHRWRTVEGMVGWRSAVGDDPVGARWEDGDAIALSRGERGTVVANGGDAPLEARVPTTLRDGEYCDVLAGPTAAAGTDGPRCTGDPVRVEDGEVAVRVPAGSAVALHVGARAEA